MNIINCVCPTPPKTTVRSCPRQLVWINNRVCMVSYDGLFALRLDNGDYYRAECECQPLAKGARVDLTANADC